MNCFRHLCGLGFIAALIAIQFCGGCQSSPAGAHGSAAAPSLSDMPHNSKAENEALADSDGCAAKLQDIGGLFLLYHLQNHQMPKSLDDLRSLPGASDVGDFVCPVSKKPYIYNPAGIRSPSGAGLIVVYDPEPSHFGQRMCLEIIQLSSPGQTKVIPLPEAFFKGK